MCVSDGTDRFRSGAARDSRPGDGPPRSLAVQSAHSVSTSFDRDLSMSFSRPAEGSCVVSMSGDLDSDSAAEFSARLDDMTAAAGIHVIVELAGVQFIDSSGLNSLVVGARETERRGGSFVVAAPSQYVARVFDLVRIGESIDVVGSIDEALAVGSAVSEQVDS